MILINSERETETISVIKMYDSTQHMKYKRWFHINEGSCFMNPGKAKIDL